MPKCSKCGKKTHILFECKCDLKDLCITCKAPEVHDCKFNYKEEQKNKLKKDNPIISLDKVVNRI